MSAATRNEAERKRQAAVKLASIRAHLAEIERLAATEAERATWGNVGDLGYVNSQLYDPHEFLRPAAEQRGK